MKEHENAPCPCESGKRYVDCCLGLHLARSQENPARALNEEAQRILRDRNFESLDNETKPRGEDPLDRRFFLKASPFLDKLLTWKI